MKNDMTLNAISVKEKWHSNALLYAGYTATGILLLALLSKLSIPLPFSPVPLTMQSFGVLLIGALFSPRLAVFTIALFLAQGLIGLPVFSVGPTFGIARFLGPTGGYLLGYLLAGVTVSSMLKKGWSLHLSLIAGTVSIWALGAFHLSSFIGVKHALLQGVLPFVVGDLVKILFLGKIVPVLKKKLPR